MSTEALVTHYGALAILLGAGIEGETLVLAGGVLAFRHLLPLPQVMIAAAIGSFVADQLFFSAGRYFRDHPRVQRWMATPRARKAFVALETHPDGFILSIRFLYGLRTISPIAVGASHIERSRFLALNALAACVWAALFAGIGYGLGAGLAPFLHRVRTIVPLLAAAIVVVVLFWALSRLCWRRYHHVQTAREASR